MAILARVQGFASLLGHKPSQPTENPNPSLAKQAQKTASQWSFLSFPRFHGIKDVFCRNKVSPLKSVTDAAGPSSDLPTSSETSAPAAAEPTQEPEAWVVVGDETDGLDPQARVQSITILSPSIIDALLANLQALIEAIIQAVKHIFCRNSNAVQRISIEKSPEPDLLPAPLHHQHHQPGVIESAFDALKLEDEKRRRKPATLPNKSKTPESAIPALAAEEPEAVDESIKIESAKIMQAKQQLLNTLIELICQYSPVTPELFVLISKKIYEIKDFLMNSAPIGKLSIEGEEMAHVSPIEHLDLQIENIELRLFLILKDLIELVQSAPRPLPRPLNEEAASPLDQKMKELLNYLQEGLDSAMTMPRQSDAAADSSGSEEVKEPLTFDEIEEQFNKLKGGGFGAVVTHKMKQDFKDKMERVTEVFAGFRAKFKRK